jgi:hypothetical protein
MFAAVFRDSFLKPLNAAKPNDYDDLSQKLDVAGNTLDYRKYSDSLFEILIIGGILGKSYWLLIKIILHVDAPSLDRILTEKTPHPNYGRLCLIS